MAISKLLTYNRQEKLKSRKLTEYLFKKGKSIAAFPVKALYDVVENTAATLQAGVTVSSRKFKKAADRNRIKRVMREAYRLQKIPLQNILRKQNISLAVFFIYNGNELPLFAEVYKKIGIILQKLENHFKNISPDIENAI